MSVSTLSQKKKKDKADKSSILNEAEKRENMAVIRDLISKAEGGRCPFLEQGMSNTQKRLEFSSMSLCVYTGHKSLINDVFLNPNIK